MVNTGALYAITAGTAGITIITIIVRILATEHKELIDSKLVNLFRFLFAFCMVDMIWGLLASKIFIVNQFAYTLFSYAFHLGAALSAFLWAGYVIHYLKVDEKYGMALDVCRASLLLIQLTVLISNVWTNSFFFVDKDANYHSYKMRNVMFALQFLYYIALIIYSLMKLPVAKYDTDKEQKRRYASTIKFSCVPLLFGFCQMIWPDAAMYSLGFMVTAVLIYSMNISSEREGYLRTIYLNENNKLQEVVLGLSNDYQAIYLVNLDNNEYEEFGGTEEYKRKISSNFENTNDFFEDVSVNMKKVVLTEDQDEVLNMLRKGRIASELTSKKSYSFNYRVRVGGREKYYLCKVVKLAKGKDKSNRVIIGVFDDDNRVRKEIEQRKILEDALATAKNASKAKTDFLFNMSHDIRTPMNSIIGFTNLAQKHIDDKKYLSECLDKVSLSGDHLLSLINDVLDMSRIESGKLVISAKPESIIKRNEQIVSIVQELALTKSIIFNHSLVGIEKEWILCDALHLNQIILNILSNAIKYTKPGGRVNYTIEQTVLNDNEIALKFIVQDTGIGMSKEFLDKIYDEFERENSATTSGVHGTGLGMSIVKRLVDMMGGSIDIESTQGVGTKVTVIGYFDITEPVENDTIEEICELPEGRRVLLVDDNALNREIAVDILEELGVSCEEASDGTEAVEIVQKCEPGYFDLILMDVQMPIMNGYEATQKIRNLGNSMLASIPIIAMTANAFDEDKKDAYDAGMNAHLSKPIDIGNLAKTLKEFL